MSSTQSSVQAQSQTDTHSQLPWRPTTLDLPSRPVVAGAQQTSTVISAAQALRSPAFPVLNAVVHATNSGEAAASFFSRKIAEVPCRRRACSSPTPARAPTSQSGLVAGRTLAAPMRLVLGSGAACISTITVSEVGEHFGCSNAPSHGVWGSMYLSTMTVSESGMSL